MDSVQAIIDLQRRVEWLENNYARHEPAPTMHRQSGTITNACGIENTKSYEILAFRATGKDNTAINVFERNADGTFEGYSESCMLYESACVTSGHWEIYRVRRLSDGTVWELGMSTKQGLIDRFRVVPTGMIVDCGSYTFTLNELTTASDWEIVEFKGVLGGMYGIDEHGMYKSLDEISSARWRANEMNEFECTIHAVRRTSDNTIWRINDRCNSDARIIRFKIVDNQVNVLLEVGGYIGIEDLIKDTAIFTTADGVPAYEGDTIWMVTRAGIIKNTAERNKTYTGDLYHKEAAAREAYKSWLYSQPVLTMDDVAEFVSSPQFCKLVDIVKEKINKA